MLNVHHIEDKTRIYGPGVRTAIWFQGCTIHCKGCWNKQMWSHEPHDLFTIEELFDRIQANDVQGVTLLGGEPLNQADEAAQLVRLLKAAGLTTVLYTGYEFDEIAHDSGARYLFECSDIVISGRYIEDLRDINLRWRGSTNQTITIHNSVYAKSAMYEMNQMEITFDENGSITTLGYPNEDLTGLLKGKE